MDPIEREWLIERRAVDHFAAGPHSLVKAFFERGGWTYFASTHNSTPIERFIAEAKLKEELAPAS